MKFADSEAPQIIRSNFSVSIVTQFKFDPKREVTTVRFAVKLELS